MGTGENAGGNPAMDLASHPGRSRITPCRYILQKPEISAGLMSLPRLVIQTYFYSCSGRCVISEICDVK